MKFMFWSYIREVLSEKLKIKIDKSFFKFSMMYFHTKSFLRIKKISLINIYEKSLKTQTWVLVLSNNGHPVFTIKRPGKSRQWKKNYEICQIAPKNVHRGVLLTLSKLHRKKKGHFFFLLHSPHRIKIWKNLMKRFCVLFGILHF